MTEEPPMQKPQQKPQMTEAISSLMADDWMFGCDKTAAVTEQESRAAAGAEQSAWQEAATEEQATASIGQTLLDNRERQHADGQLAGVDGQDCKAEGQTELNVEQSLAAGHSEHATGRLSSLHSAISFSNVLPPVPVHPGPQLQKQSAAVATASIRRKLLPEPQPQQQIAEMVPVTSSKGQPSGTLQSAAMTNDASDFGHLVSSGQGLGFAAGAEEPGTDFQSAQQVLCILCGTVAGLLGS